jgi:hypothetical protein
LQAGDAAELARVVGDQDQAIDEAMEAMSRSIGVRRPNSAQSARISILLREASVEWSENEAVQDR